MSSAADFHGRMGFIQGQAKNAGLRGAIQGFGQWMDEERQKQEFDRRQAVMEAKQMRLAEIERGWRKEDAAEAREIALADREALWERQDAQTVAANERADAVRAEERDYQATKADEILRNNLLSQGYGNQEMTTEELILASGQAQASARDMQDKRQLALYEKQTKQLDLQIEKLQAQMDEAKEDPLVKHARLMTLSSLQKLDGEAAQNIVNDPDALKQWTETTYKNMLGILRASQLSPSAPGPDGQAQPQKAIHEPPTNKDMSEVDRLNYVGAFQKLVTDGIGERPGGNKEGANAAKVKAQLREMGYDEAWINKWIQPVIDQLTPGFDERSNPPLVGAEGSYGENRIPMSPYARPQQPSAAPVPQAEPYGGPGFDLGLSPIGR